MREVICSGGLFLSMSSKRFLFLHRTQGKTADTWGLVGGKKEPVDEIRHEDATGSSFGFF